MATIRSLTESFGVLKRNPVVFAVGLLYAVIVLPQTAMSLMGIPLVPRLFQIVTFFITPFVLAGLLGMTYEGRVRATGFGTFTKIGKKKYVSVLAGNLINFVITAVFGFVTFIVVVFTIGLTFSAAQSESVLSSIGIVFVAVLAGLGLVYLLVMFFLQFYAPAIVTDNVGVIEGYRRSVGLVKRNIVQTLGFGVLNLLLGLLLLLPAIALVVVTIFGAGALGAGATAGAGSTGASGISGSTGGTGLSLVLIAGIIGYSFITTVLMTPFRAAFSVSFYDNHRPAQWE
ncbi:hypothetical protein NDI56_04355 [Haloarcula sp. S1CR25-12]|uniref:DUF7847 domain-containing protein n=1 Tax=Haloarcula saliterrae TaxID=2950534 RepID=A0ABU2F8M7_9EURY|nr:hypothetical protein [Haloarcula sp. S1CR25-12]MDS0258643.1 hypothetical protein [Haloarcula sp. S1CR25-12]